MMLQGSLCRSHLWRRIPFSSFGKHFLSCPQFGRCCRGLRGGRQSCRQSLRNVGSFAVFGGASCWPGSRSTKRCSPPTYDGGNKLLENLIKLICMRTGIWKVLNLLCLFIHFWFSNEITPYFCEALRPLSEKEVFLKKLVKYQWTGSIIEGRFVTVFLMSSFFASFTETGICVAFSVHWSSLSFSAQKRDFTM